MASVTENRPPEPAPSEPARSEERYVDDQIRRTRRALKMVDLTAGMLTLVVGVLAYLFTAAVLEHWIVPGGWSPTARAMLLIVLVGGVGWYSWRIFWPLVSKPINPAFAAQAIEKSSPSLKNSLLNLLLLRDRRRQISRQVYQAIERQAAQRLSEVPVDSVIDRGAIIQLGRVLAVVVALYALYLWLSPKNPIESAGRLLMPWSDIAVPSRVKIRNVQPGNTAAARGEQLTVSAEITGLSEEEPVRVRYSTADGQIIGQEVLMAPQEGGLHFECRLPGRIAPGGNGGIQNELSYWIEAGDAQSPRYEVTVFSQPTLVVDRIRYEYPSYTGYAPREVEHTGDISAVEGTVVTISAVSNQPIDTAHVDFEADGRHDLLMNSEDRQATTSFPLELREDRRTPRYQSYVLRYSTEEGRKNPDPPKYRIDVERDYAPEIELLAPTEEILDVGLNEQVVIEVEARDPDYAVRNVSILGEVAGSQVLKKSLLSRDHTGRFVSQLRIVPAELDLNEGDVLEYWAAAADNRRPEPNLAFTKHQKLRIVGPGEGGGQQEGSQDGKGEQEGEGENGEGEQGEGGQDGQAGGAGDESGQGNPEDQQGGEGGSGQQGDNQGENANDQQGSDGESAEGDDQTDDDSDGSTGGNSPSDSSENSSSQENSETAEGDSGNDPSGGEPSGGEGKVSPEGDDDGEAFERIAEHFEQQEGDSKGTEGEAGENAGDEQESKEDGQSGEGSTEESEANKDDTGDAQQQEADEAAGDQGESESEGAAGEDSPQQESGDAEQSDSQEDPSGTDGGTQEKQGPAGAGENPGEEQGAPDPSADKKPNDKPSEDAAGDAPNDQEAPSEGKGEHESDSQGGQGGDRTGGGQEGAGQQSDNEGTGAAGENQAADDGSGQAGEQGDGETGDQPGGEQQAAGETGESSGNQEGQGSEQSDDAGNQAGGEQSPSPDQQASENQSQSDAPSGGQPEAGGSGSSSAKPPPSSETEPGDAANLDYAREQTNLVIDKLDDQLKSDDVDKELLNKLGWTADELRRFVDRWKNLKTQASGSGEQAEQARQELDNALRSLGLRRDLQSGFQSQTAKDKLRDLQEAYRGRTPLEYQELMRKYVKGTAEGNKQD